jgi:hypothetical protein
VIEFINSIYAESPSSHLTIKDGDPLLRMHNVGLRRRTTDSRLRSRLRTDMDADLFSYVGFSDPPHAGTAKTADPKDLWQPHEVHQFIFRACKRWIRYNFDAMSCAGVSFSLVGLVLWNKDGDSRATNAAPPIFRTFTSVHHNPHP